MWRGRQAKVGESKAPFHPAVRSLHLIRAGRVPRAIVFFFTPAVLYLIQARLHAQFACAHLYVFAGTTFRFSTFVASVLSGIALAFQVAAVPFYG